MDDVKAMPEKVTEDVALRFLEQRKAKMMEIYENDEEIRKAKEQEKRLKSARRKKKDELRQMDDEQAVIMTMAKVPTPEEEIRNRGHFPVQTFFDFLNMADDETGWLSKKYNGLHDIKKVCEFFLACVWQSHGKDGNRNLLTLDVDKFIKMIDAEYTEQVKRRKMAEQTLHQQWDALVADDAAIRAVKQRLHDDAERSSRLKKSNTGKSQIGNT